MSEQEALLTLQQLVAASGPLLDVREVEALRLAQGWLEEMRRLRLVVYGEGRR